MRVEAGDGAEGGKNCHFNFNVLDDATLVNVFDAAGYLANNKIVLHNDLYGAGEKPEAPVGQVLTATSGVAKNTIYGNGYQVNLKAYNATLPNKNESTAITFNNLYNVKMKGDTENTTLNNETQKVYFSVEKVYYCDMSYYYKLGAGKLTYIKNSVFHDIPKVAIQVWNNQVGDENKKKAYIENITIASCGSGINLEGDGDGKSNTAVYLKGFFDVLDYNNKTGMQNISSTVETFFKTVVGNISGYLEWFGNKMNKESDFDKVYVNVAFYADHDINGAVFVWNGSDQYVNSNLEQSDLKIKIMNLALNYYAGTYDYANTTDGGTIEVSSGFLGIGAQIKSASRDMNKLFTDERYIRLLCEYKNKDEKNDDHILWHMQKVYRDISLIAGREPDHIKHLKSTLKDVTWPDGTNANDYLGGEAVALYKMLSQAIVPGKNSYAD